MRQADYSFILHPRLGETGAKKIDGITELRLAALSTALERQGEWINRESLEPFLLSVSLTEGIFCSGCGH